MAGQKRMSFGERFMLVTDNDCHWYIIPADQLIEWGAFLHLSPDDEESWNVPKWAKPVGGSPCRLTFTNPVIE